MLCNNVVRGATVVLSRSLSCSMCVQVSTSMTCPAFVQRAALSYGYVPSSSRQWKDATGWPQDLAGQRIQTENVPAEGAYSQALMIFMIPRQILRR